MSSPTITVTFTLKDVQDFFAAVPAQHRMAALDILMRSLMNVQAPDPTEAPPPGSSTPE